MKRAVVVMLLMALLAGCTGEQDVETQGVSEQDSSGEGEGDVVRKYQEPPEDPEAEPGDAGPDGGTEEGTGTDQETKQGPMLLQNHTRDDWFLMPVTAAPEGRLNSFPLKIPDGALESDSFRDEDALFMEIAPLKESVDAEAWFMGVGLQGGDLLRSAYSQRLDSEFTFLGTTQTDASGPSFRPFYATLYDVDEGDVLSFVVGARGNGTMAFGIRFLLEDPWTDGYTGPSEDEGEFLDKVEDATMRAPVAQGTGAGLSIGYFYELRWTTTGGPIALRSQGGLDVRDDSPVDEAGLRPRTDITVEGSGPAGFTIASAMYFGGERAGEVAVAAQAGDAQAQHDGPYVWDPAGGAAIVMGIPYAVVIADGPMDASLAVDVTTAGTERGFPEYTSALLVRLGVPLADLANMDVETYAYSYNGVLSPGAGRDAPQAIEARWPDIWEAALDDAFDRSGP